MSLWQLLRAAMWAGFIALDITGVGPLMVSQPLVCGPIFGWLMGNLAAGVVIGGVVQLLWMDVTPVGVGVPFDAMAVTILGVFWGSGPGSGPADWVVALMLAVPFGYLFQSLDKYARRVNTLIARMLESVADEHLTHALILGILSGLLWSWVRYSVFYFFALLLGKLILIRLDVSPAITWLNAHSPVALALLPIAGMGVVLELFLSEEPERRFQAFRHKVKKSDVAD